MAFGLAVVPWELSHQIEIANILGSFLFALRTSLKGACAEVNMLQKSAVCVAGTQAPMGYWKEHLI